MECGLRNPRLIIPDISELTDGMLLIDLNSDSEISIITSHEYQIANGLAQKPEFVGKISE